MLFPRKEGREGGREGGRKEDRERERERERETLCAMLGDEKASELNVSFLLAKQ